MSLDTLTFANFDPLRALPSDIYQIGATESTKGIILQAGDAFGIELGETPSPENLEGLAERVYHVQDVFDSDPDLAPIGRAWIDQSGLLVPVRRSFMSAFADMPQGEVIGVMVGSACDSIEEGITTLQELNWGNNNDYTALTLLVGSDRVMEAGEAQHVEDGMTEADYLERVVATRLGDIGLVTEAVRTDSTDNESIMAAAAAAILQYNVDGLPIVLIATAVLG